MDSSGSTIGGYATDDYFGYRLAISKDGTRLVVGASKDDEGGTDAGKVLIYDYVDNDWSLIKSYIGDSVGDQMGISVAIRTKNIVAFSARKDDGNGADSGEVRIVEFSPNVSTTTVFALGDDNYNKLEMTTSDVTTSNANQWRSCLDVSYNGMLSDFTHIVGAINNKTMKLYMNNTLVDSTLVDTAKRQINKTLIATNPVEDTANPQNGEWPSGPKLLDTNINYTLDDITINDDAINHIIHQYNHHTTSPLTHTDKEWVFKTPVQENMYVYLIMLILHGLYILNSTYQLRIIIYI